MRGSESNTTLMGGDHREIDALFEEAFEALARADAEAAHLAIDRAWMRLAVHIRAEHKVLFPALPEQAGLAELILELRADHDVFMETLARLLMALRKPGVDFASITTSLSQVDVLLQAHNDREETRIYPCTEDFPCLLPRLSAELAFLPDRYKS